ncbi:hypothetical protein GCM10027447_04070 [Glycomyces halotolerans]
MVDASPTHALTEPAPTFTDMPGVTKAAVVLLWVMFGFGTCGAVFTVIGITFLARLGLAGMPTAVGVLFVLGIVQGLVWTVLRAVFAVKIARRRSTGSRGVIALEVVGLVLAVVSSVASFVWFTHLLNDTMTASGVEASTSSNAGGMFGTVFGAALSCVVIGLLLTQDSRNWCDR